MKSGIVPLELIKSLQNVSGFDEESFVSVHENHAQVVSVRINPRKVEDVQTLFPETTKVPWSSYGYYLPERPSFILDPALHAGAYYVQEASGMFLEQCLKQTVDLAGNIRALDLCAAPGGKSTLLQSLLSANSMLVSNEVIKTRVSVLIENMRKWGGENVVITHNDPRDFARLPAFFDVMVVDAPCSGSGLFRRDPEAVNEWSEDAVKTCSLRQQRILADAYDCLKKEGVLIYSTCSYSPEEDEHICDWLLSNYQLESIRLKTEQHWNVVETVSDVHGAFGYRFFPNKLKGEGLYVACFRKKDGMEYGNELYRKSKLEKVTAAEKSVVLKWIAKDASLNFYRHKEEVLAFPSSLESDLIDIRSSLNIRMAGITVGKTVRDELLPDHNLALSRIANSELPSISLKKDEARQYLRKEEVTIAGTHRGWALVKYNGLTLGWVKILQNRVNNYYPKEWRILKTGNS